jgi:hypothetical protein
MREWTGYSVFKPCERVCAVALFQGTCHATQFLVPRSLRHGVVLVAALGMACSGEPSMDRNTPLNIEEVHVRADPSDIMVQYRTPTPIRDCKAHAAEMPKVWDLVVKDRLGESVERVTLFPENPSGESASTTFVKSADGEWASTALCRAIKIQRQ